MRTILVAGLLFCCGPSLAYSHEINGGVPRSRTFGTADLDLSRPDDVTELHRRMRLALDDVCGPFAGANPDTIPAVTRCRTQASARARQAMSALIARAGETRSAAR